MLEKLFKDEKSPKAVKILWPHVLSSEYFLICIFHYFQKLFIENLTEFKKKKAKIVIDKSTVIVLCIT